MDNSVNVINWSCTWNRFLPCSGTCLAMITYFLVYIDSLHEALTRVMLAACVVRCGGTALKASSKSKLSTTKGSLH
jgi:hypothetical protein